MTDLRPALEKQKKCSAYAALLRLEYAPGRNLVVAKLRYMDRLF